MGRSDVGPDGKTVPGLDELGSPERPVTIGGMRPGFRVDEPALERGAPVHVEPSGVSEGYVLLVVRDRRAALMLQRALDLSHQRVKVLVPGDCTMGCRASVAFMACELMGQAERDWFDYSLRTRLRPGGEVVWL